MWRQFQARLVSWSTTYTSIRNWLRPTEEPGGAIPPPGFFVCGRAGLRLGSRSRTVFMVRCDV